MNEFDKQKITQLVYNQLPANNPWQGFPYDKLVFLWWETKRVSTNLRLSEEGKKAFDLAEIAYYKFDIKVEKENFSQFIIKVGKKLKCPFYIGFKNHLYKSAYIVVYDSRIAMMITLYGSFTEYFDK